MKDYLIKFIKDKKDKLTEIREKIEKSQSVDEVRSLGDEIVAIQEEIREAQAVLDKLDSADPTPAGEARGLNPLATYGVGQKPVSEETRDADPLDTLEYRTAFMEFVCRNVPIPAELRANQTTTTTDASAAIPTTLQNEIIQKLESYGNLYARVRHLNVQGGVEFPILSLKPTATWQTEGTANETQKLTANTKVSFSYYGLECKIAQSLLTSVTTVDAFQALFTTLATEAIIKKVEEGIIKGTGSGQMLGITVDSRVPAGNTITLSSADMTSWAAWKKKVFAKIPKAYRNGVFIMAQGTFDGYIDGMVDSVGQPIGRVNYGIAGDTGESYRFGGKVVETVENDIIEDYDTASTNDVIAVYCRLSDYAINTNMQMAVNTWMDYDTNEKKTKATIILDGKLLDTNGVLIIKKGA